ncbi:hypothetical protein [Microcoleus sp.]|uniref:hypothetical protein n=1 Tax=Microcoleus sp. TaxID=44472 RepID=UPI00359486F5
MKYKPIGLPYGFSTASLGGCPDGRTMRRAMERKRRVEAKKLAKQNVVEVPVQQKPLLEMVVTSRLGV